MRERHTIEIMGMLATAYPDRQVNKQTVELYARMLEDLDQDALKAAVLRHISTNKWFPTIAEIREAAVKSLPGNDLPTAYEAWREVCESISRVGYYGTPQWSNEAISQAVRGLGGWQEVCTSTNQEADRAHFFRIYDAHAERKQRDAQMLPEVRHIMQQLAERTEPQRGGEPIPIARLVSRIGGSK